MPSISGLTHNSEIDALFTPCNDILRQYYFQGGMVKRKNRINSLIKNQA